MKEARTKAVDVKFSGESHIAREDKKSEVLGQIRKNCVECAGDSTEETKYCSAVDCELWPYRFGRTPGSVRRNAEGKELLDKANFTEGGRFDPDKMASKCQ